MERLNKRVDLDDPIAIHDIGCYYNKGKYGFPQDYKKSLERWQKAAELGYAAAYIGIGLAYNNGDGVEVDKEKARYYYELSAMGGDEDARFNLGILEEKAGNSDRALKHHMIAVRSGYSNSLKCVKRLYSNGDATKEDYTKALRSYQEYLGEIKSVQRDKAAAAHERYRYY